jgi:hypothetical protein
LGLNAVLVLAFVFSGPKVEWLSSIFAAVGAIPCLVVLGRTILPTSPADSKWKVSYRDEPIDVSAEIVYRPRVAKLMLMCVPIGIISLFSIRDGEVIGWLGAAFFGFCMAAFILQLVPGCCHLRVSTDGLEIRRLWRSRNYRWAEISNFYVGSKIVTVAFTTTYRSSNTDQILDDPTQGTESVLPETYGFTAEALAEQLICWKAAYTAPREAMTGSGDSQQRAPQRVLVMRVQPG